MRYVLTTREKVLVIVLAVIILGFCYYNFFLSPLNDQVTTYNNDAANLETEITINTVQVARMNQMKEEVEELKASGANTIPEYDNSQNVIIELNTILQNAQDYTLSFDATSNIDYVVLRPVYMTFTTDTYAEARAIIDELYASEYAMRISDLNITVTGDAYNYTIFTNTNNVNYTKGYVTTSLRITYFEIDQNYAAAAE